jgi:ATP-dependent protease HslVU (ClpYQ) ATPase subunit
MIRDLMSAGFQMVKTEMLEAVKGEAEKRVEDRILDILLPGIKAAANPWAARRSPWPIPEARDRTPGSVSDPCSGTESWRTGRWR